MGGGPRAGGRERREVGDNLPTAEMTSVSEKEGRKRLQRNGGGGSENGEGGGGRRREMWPFVRHFVKREGKRE